MAPPQRRRVPADDRPACGLLRAAALLRPGIARGFRQIAGVRVVPHTHWDREWYLPFQRFRLRLVGLVDRLLEAMEEDVRYRFTLDGQLATLDDYLEVRPEAEPRIRRLVEEGRLAIGPWQVLMDEFFVSGETIVRNLEEGLRRGEELGGAMRIGYLPDMFGHVAQMPQILRLAGIDQAVVWRGVPAAIDSHVFEWEAPDGSSVRTEYLPRGYGNAATLLDDPDRFVQELETVEESLRPFYGDDPVLAMLGDDHREPLTRLPAGLEVVTLADYLANDDRSGLPRWMGELRSGARANLLMGTTSARIDLKAAMARAERVLTRYAEPFQALYGALWPERLLELAWRRVIENSAHDSICGCSADEVSAQVLVRCAEAEQIGSGLAEDAAAQVARQAPRGSVVVLNPSPEARVGFVELDVDETALELPDGSLVAAQKVAGGLIANVPVPPLGWIAIRPVSGSGEVDHPVRAGALELDNGLLAIAVADDGTLELGGLRGVGRIVESGDTGDSYNYAPPEVDHVVEQPETVSVDPVESGPVRGRLQVVRRYRWQGLPVDVTTSVELRAGEPFCRLRVSFENPCADHRVRFHIPLAEPAQTSAAEGQFAVVERGLDAEGGFGEEPLPTFPAYGFVGTGGVAVLLDHVMEYELVDNGRELALTLLRSIGLISRDGNPYRKVPAGPELEIPAAQLRGPWSVEFALFPHGGAWHEAGVLAQLERYRHPFLTTPGTGEGVLAEQRGIELRGDGVVLSSLRRRGGALEARLVCEHPEPVKAVFGEAELDLRPWEIRAVELAG